MRRTMANIVITMKTFVADAILLDLLDLKSKADDEVQMVNYSCLSLLL